MKNWNTYILGIILAGGLMQCKQKNMEYYMIVGTYSSGGSKGIYVYDFNANSAETKLISTNNDTKNPSYVTTSNDKIYAVSETNGDDPGSVSAYNFDKEKGKLEFINNLPTGGDDPCFVEADASGKVVAVANYSGGSVSAFHTKDNGALQENKQLIQHEGGSINPDRQQGPHVHQSIFTPDQKYLLTPDLGKDAVMVYKFDKDAEEPLSLHSQITCDPGSGPRHIAFHPVKNYAYLIHELIPVVSVFTYKNGEFKKIQEVNAWPEGFTGNKDGAEVMVSPDGKFLYTSQRGDQNSIAIFSIDTETGQLSLKSFQPVLGKGPRFFTIDPSGNYLLAANQQSNNISIFRIDRQTGALTSAGNLDIPTPVCIKFIAKK